MIKEFNIKKLLFVEEAILLFREEKICLARLVTCLGEFFHSIESWSAQWDAVFFQKMVDLESVYAGAVDADSTTLDAEDVKIIERSINELITLVRDALSGYEAVSDRSVPHKASAIDEEWLFCPICQDAWQCISNKAMVICPKCDQALHNPRREL